MLDKRSPSKVENALKKVVVYVGLATASLSLFYALREGYYFIEDRQEQRAAIESYTAAAAQFEQLDNLDYAVETLGQVLAIKPNDVTLQRRHFMLRAHSVLREVEDWPGAAYEEGVQESITALTLDGFRILQFTPSKPERPQILIMLGRLLRQNVNWSDEARITSLFEEAYHLAPDDAEVAFRYGQWLLTEAEQPEKGGELLQRATQLQPENALYWGTLGQYKLEKKAYLEALSALRTAIQLHPKQNEIQRTRASNASKGILVRLVREAHEEYDITRPDFLGLDMEERKTLLEKALSYGPSDRPLHFLPAQFYHARGDPERAVGTLKVALSDDELISVL